MLILFGILCFLVGTAFFLGMPALWIYTRSLQLRDPRTILCPETLRAADISIDATTAARTEFAGRMRSPLLACSRWPARRDCRQECLPQFPFVGDDRRLSTLAPFALHPSFLRINNPVRMTPALYARLNVELAHSRQA